MMNGIKEIVMLNDELNESEYKPFQKENYLESYERFAKRLEEEGIGLKIASHNDYKEGIVEKHWVLESDWQLKKEKLKPKVIFDKFSANDRETREIKKDIQKRNIKTLNPIEMETLFKDKMKCVEFFKEQSPPTIDAKGSLEEMKEKIKELRKNGKCEDFDYNTLFLKPKYGHGGKGIKFVKGDNFEELKSIIGQEYIIQPKLKIMPKPELGLNGLYDLRIVSDRNELVVAYARIPENGLVSNAGEEGTLEVYIEKEKIPEELKKFIDIINKKLEKYEERLISIDLAYGESGMPWLFELNGKPGIVVKNNYSRRRAIETQEATIKVLKKMVE